MWIAFYVQSIFLQAGILGLRLIMGFLAVSLGASAFELGLLAATYAAPAILFAIPFGIIIRRFRSAIVVLLGVIVCIIACHLAMFSQDIPLLLLASIILGLGQVACLIGQQTFPAEFIAGAPREKVYGHMTSAMSVGQLLGPLFATGIPTIITEEIGTQIQIGLWVGFLTLCSSLLVSTLVLFHSSRQSILEVPRVQEPEQTRRIGIPGFWRNLIISGVVITSVDLLYAFLPAWAVEKQISAFEVGLLLTVRSLFTVVSRFSLSLLIKWLGRKLLLTVCLVSGAIAMVALPFAGFWFALLLMIIVGYALGLPQPMTIAWLVDRASPLRRAPLLALRVSANRAIQVSLPIVITAGVTGLGISGVFFGISFCLAVGVYTAVTAGKVFDS